MTLKKVIVTGGAGYIGSHVAFCLSKTRKYKVISIDNGHNSLSESLVRVSKLSKEDLVAETQPEGISREDLLDSTEIISKKADLTNVAQIRAVFEEHGKGGIWGVVHIAAYKAVGESSDIPLTYYQNNVCATVSLLQIMEQFECRRLVYSSSATVYGTPPEVPIPETSPLQAQSPYGKTKVMCETIIDDLCHATPSWQAISLRYFNPAGAHPSGLIGEDPKGRALNLLPILAHMAVGLIPDSVLKVFGNDYAGTVDGTCVRDYLHVMDLASGHVLALKHLDEEAMTTIFNTTEVRYKAYNLGTGHGQSVLQITEAMRRASGFDYKTEVVERRRGDVPALIANPALAEKELGFHAEADLDTMCRDLWNWQSKNPKGYAT